MSNARASVLATVFALYSLVPVPVPAAGQPGLSPSLWSDLRYRMIGPERGGRVTTVTGIPSEPFTFYMGSTGGGVWKTTDAGHNWNNVSDGFFSVASIGAIEVSQANPNIVFAGTGSSKIRSNVSIGRGIYKSSDAGKTWSLMGLRNVGQIATVRIHPANPDIVYVAASGIPFGPNKERGVYRTSDGGKTWKQVLFVSDTAGAADLELKPGDPDTIFACMWHGERKPWSIISGALEGGIYKSTDGGNTWAKLAGGLPSQLFGRSNVAISAANPNRVYALIEAKPGSGLYRSEDGGSTWSLINSSASLITRPFYYCTLGVDPNNPDNVYVGDEGWFRSADGGKTFRTLRVPHGDNHDVWINPKNSQYMIQSNDGGANISLDGGNTWSVQSNQPTAEIYQVAVDNQYPYRVYGAQQDNTTVIVPSMPLSNGQTFRTGPGCETGPIIPDLAHPEIVYGSCKGQFSRQNINTNNETRYWIGAESLYGNAGSELTYRFQRVSPMEVSPFEPRTIFYGSQYLHKTMDGGVSWQKVSPDLTAHPEGTQGASGEPITRDATGEEVYSTLYTIRESPLKRGLIWTGSNDGLIHVTRDGGETWSNVTPKGLPGGARVQNIEPSPHRMGTAYVAIYRFLLGDFAPYLYRTDDYGKSWTLLTDGKNGIAHDEPTRVVREDPDRPKLLYAGTEFGMHVSFDDGATWQPFQLNLPVTPVTDIKVAHKDLVLSTQGRSFWILNNLTPLHQISEKTTGEITLFTPRVAVRTPGRAALEGLGPAGGGLTYPRPGAAIDYYLPTAVASAITLEILDASGNVVRKFSSEATLARVADGGDEEQSERPRGAPPAKLEKTAGMHRFVWDLKYPGPWLSDTRPEGPNGPSAVPGKYQVRLRRDNFSATKSFEVMEDSGVTASGVTTADLREQFEHNLRARDLVTEANKMAEKIHDAQKRLAGEPAKLAKVNELASRFFTPPVRYSKPELQTQITYLYTAVNGPDQKIGEDVIARYKALHQALEKFKADLNKEL